MAAAVALAAIMPAVASAAPTVTVSVDGTRLTLVGDASANNASVYADQSQACPGGSPCYAIVSADDVVAAAVPCVVTETGDPLWIALCPSAGIAGITVIGREGDDNLKTGALASLGLAVPALLEGGAGKDNLSGSQGEDVVRGGEDDDYLSGGSADDLLVGGAGDDYLRGGSEADVLRGGGGEDYLYGRGGEDLLQGGRATDYISGNAGRDRLIGGLGVDYLTGGLGADRLFGSRGADFLYGSKGRDRCDGGRQRDRAQGCERRIRIP